MTEPTQAQIEAAAKVIYANISEETLDLCRDIAKAALTAAAQVGSGPVGATVMPEGHTAAAEVPPEDRNNTAYKAGLRDGIAATIERCAQVAKNYKGATNNTVQMHREICLGIAAAIRALATSEGK